MWGLGKFEITTLRLRRIVLSIGTLAVPAVAVFFFAFRAPGRRIDEPGIIRDGSGLVAIRVRDTLTPSSTDEVHEILRSTRGPISIGGARYSMGGQVAAEGATFIDTRARLDQVLELDVAGKRARVEAGITWRKLQEAIDPYDLAVKIMQTYDNFTVGGTLSVNGHGRYVGHGPVVQSVRSIELVLADGSRIHASREENADLFWGAIGGYGGLGVITEAELDLTDNIKLERSIARLRVEELPRWFEANVRRSRDTIFFNADLYPPDFKDALALTYARTDREVTEPARLQSRTLSTTAERFAYWMISEVPGGKRVREELIDALRYARPEVVWKNFEASYDVRTLEPTSRDRTTYALQEYFIPPDRFDSFLPKMRRVFRSHGVNVLNLSIRHCDADPGTLLSWAPTERFALVVYYKQGLDAASREAVGRWTRDMIDNALSEGGGYYLPYQLDATREQFLRAYPRAREFYSLKQRVDPENRFRNSMWNKYLVAPF
jgi:FAD/FMN-containing dehydrogenase